MIHPRKYNKEVKKFSRTLKGVKKRKKLRVSKWAIKIDRSINWE